MREIFNGILIIVNEFIIAKLKKVEPYFSEQETQNLSYCYAVNINTPVLLSLSIMPPYLLYNYAVNINTPVSLSLSIMPPYLLYNEQKIHQSQEDFHFH